MDQHEDERSSKTLIEYSALIVTAITSLLYIAGDSAHRGFLAHFHLPKELFALNTTDTIVRGLEPITINYLAPAFIYLLLLAGISLLLYLVCFIAPKILGWLRTVRVQVWQYFSKDRKDVAGLVEISLKKPNSVANLLLLFMVGVLVLMSDVTASYSYGEKRANNFVTVCRPDSWENQTYGQSIGWIQLEYKSSDKSTSKIEGCIIQSGEKFLAILVNGTPVVLPQDSIVQVRVKSRIES